MTEVFQNDSEETRVSVPVLQLHQFHADLGPLSPWRADGAALWPETWRVQLVSPASLPGGGSSTCLGPPLSGLSEAPCGSPLVYPAMPTRQPGPGAPLGCLT